MLKGAQSPLHGAGTGSRFRRGRQAGQAPPLLLDLSLKLSGIAEELMQIPRGSQKLGSCAHKLQQLSPGLVQPVLPFGHGSRCCVAALDQLINHLVHGRQPLPPCRASLTGKLREFLLQHLPPGSGGMVWAKVLYTARSLQPTILWPVRITTIIILII